MDKDSLEIAVFGMTVKAIGTRAMIILAMLLLMAVTVTILLTGPQFIAMIAAMQQ